MKTTNKILAALAFGLALGAATESRAADGFNLLVGGVSYHTTRTQGNGKPWNESNKLLGIEYRINAEWSGSVSRFKNSEYAWSNVANAQWTPVKLGNFHFGGIAGIVDGYNGGMKSRSRNEILPIAGLTAEYRGETFGTQLTFVPGSPKSSPVVMLGFKVGL